MLAISMIYIISLTNNAAIYSYLLTSMNLPLLDSEFAAIDANMGFDWAAFLSWINMHPNIGWALTWAYRSTMPQILFLLLLLGFTQRKERLAEFLSLYTITMLMIVTLAGFLPAEGAYAYHSPATETYGNLNPMAGMWHHEQYIDLRNGALRIIDISKIEGLVTFPSFHTALAIITAYCARDFRVVFLVAIALNLMVIISTLTEGGHYLIDVLVAGIFTICVILAQRMMRKKSYKFIDWPSDTIADNISPNR
jgi:membrane-associated phospholipid phosphatase